MIRKLRTKFVCITMVLVTAMLAVTLVLVYRSTAEGLRQRSISALQSEVGGPMDRPGRPGQTGEPVFTLQKSPWGELKATGGAFYDLSDGDMLQDIWQQAQKQDTDSGELKEYALRFLRTEGPEGERFVFVDISAERDALGDLVGSCALIGIVSFAGFLVISILLSGWAVKPVAQAWEQQRQFVADASHELKTPLTVILTNAELLQEQEHDEQLRSQFSQNILTMSRKMRALVEGLLELARADNGQVRADMQKLDLSRLVQDAVLPFEPVYFEQGLSLNSTIEPDLTVTGSARHLKQVVDILLDNGQKYAQSGSEAQLRLKKAGKGRVQLQLTTAGTPLTAQQCKDVFKRFYRVDAARAMDDSYGLGLSIAHRIVLEHGGRIWAQGHEGGNTFYVSLPERSDGRVKNES